MTRAAFWPLIMYMRDGAIFAALGLQLRGAVGGITDCRPGMPKTRRLQRDFGVAEFIFKNKISDALVVRERMNEIKRGS